jgi:hypothetical protein
MDRLILEKMMKKAKAKVDFRDELRESDRYIKWLEKFTAKNGGFDTLALTYNADKYSEYDRKNIENIETLYEVITEFAEKNYITPISTDLGNFYSIRHNDNGFYIGSDWGQGVSFYCTRLDEVEDNALNYDDVVHNGKLPETMKKEQRLEELTLMIDKLFNEDNIPIKVIEDKTNEAFQKIKK